MAVETKTPPPDEWERCYEGNWKGSITDESFTHPAKFSFALIRRILKHMREQGWLRKGMTIVDPFAGVGCGGIACARLGHQWVGVELEPKFVEMAKANFALHVRRWLGKPLPVIIQGDSRRLSELVRASCLVSSPPFSSPGNQPSGHTQGVDRDYKEGKRKSKTKMLEVSGTPGQLMELPVGEVNSLVSSPPFEKSDSRGGIKMPEGYFDKVGGIRTQDDVAEFDRDSLCESEGQTFWHAARQILLQCHQVLKPGGHAVWVCKDFIRKGERVPFSDDWLRLCISCGFEPVCRHRSLLVKEGGERRGFRTGLHTLRTERKSFFRRLAEKKGSPRIDWEDVICIRKPMGKG